MFELIHEDATTGARIGRLTTRHGTFETPFFMPVATKANVKLASPEEVRGTGAEVLISNAFHLSLRPGTAAVARHGGLHRFMNWTGGLVTDSGGFQIIRDFSMELTDDGILLRNPLDGTKSLFTPAACMAAQAALGADIAMVLDDCAPHDADEARVAAGVQRTTHWAQACKAAQSADGQLLFAIVQGGTSPSLRKRSAESLTALDFDGYGIGGLCIGESKDAMYRAIDACVPHLPKNRPRYLMGVGSPRDLVLAIARGVDMFDSVFPTRNARHGTILTNGGHENLGKPKYAGDDGPLSEGCECYTCRNYSKSYVNYLLQEHEFYGMRLATIHNLSFIQTLIRNARQAIREDRFKEFMASGV